MAEEVGAAAAQDVEGAEPVQSPTGACSAPVTEFCNFCVEGKRHCDRFRSKACRLVSSGMMLSMRLLSVDYFGGEVARNSRKLSNGQLFDVQRTPFGGGSGFHFRNTHYSVR